MKPQWYVSCAEMGKQAADAVRDGQLKIIPDHHLKTWFNWMDNIRYQVILSNIENVNALESFILYFKINWFVVLAKTKKTRQIEIHHQPQKNLHKGKK